MGMKKGRCCLLFIPETDRSEEWNDIGLSENSAVNWLFPMTCRAWPASVRFFLIVDIDVLRQRNRGTVCTVWGITHLSQRYDLLHIRVTHLSFLAKNEASGGGSDEITQFVVFWIWY